MWSKVYTGFGYWDVYMWFIFFAIAAALVLWLRSLGRKDYKEGTDQDEIFYGSNVVPEEGSDITVPASSAYWGFMEALQGYYKVLVNMHDGDAREYVGYMILTASVLAVLVLL